MKKNIDLFNYSLQSPEQLVDEFYIKKGELIISKDPQKQNKLMETNRELLNNITAFEVALKANNKSMQNQIIKNVQNLMMNKDVNYTEFASFWAIIDVSYSEYIVLPDDEKLVFLNEAIEKYLIMRHNLYLAYGYSPTTLQVSKDAKSHKSSGQLGINKSAHILQKFGFKPLAILSEKDFKLNDRFFILTDKTGKRLFKIILNVFKINFQWSVGRENKMPDLLFKNGLDLYIVEHKHMKEGGGGQDKQVNEIIGFIDQSENDSPMRVHYVTFLDGLYFNLFTKTSYGINHKVRSQLAKIKLTLDKHPENYFVNTKGFINLLGELNSTP